MASSLISGINVDWFQEFNLHHGADELGTVLVVLDRASRTAKYHDKVVEFESDESFEIGLNKYKWVGMKNTELGYLPVVQRLTRI